ncbi:MAG: 16S rRNA (guanine(527)-N(7))-methyltransferase RsmG [Spongiibacteraceae bacterium]
MNNLPSSSSLNQQQLREQLQNGIAELPLTLPETAIAQLLQYLALLHKWNRAYNLTAVRDPAEMVSRHLLDSLAVAPYVHGDHCADVGTGAGLPGIPLAIALPQKQFTLIDSNGKKIRFIAQAIAELGLKNVKAIQCRIESMQPEQAYDVVLSRAFATLADMAQGCEQVVATQGVMLAMKGVYPQQELSELPERFKVAACHALKVPNEAGQRHLIEIRIG